MKEISWSVIGNIFMEMLKKPSLQMLLNPVEKKLFYGVWWNRIYLIMAPIAWLSKKQATVERSVFGAEFVAMKVDIEHLWSLRYKLRMMGVPIDGPSYVYGDNMSVIHNTQRPESTLKKKSNSICFHAVRESVAMQERLTGHVSSENNPADIATKIVPPGRKRDHLVSMISYDLADGLQSGRK
jgi:hypothetical protein